MRGRQAFSPVIRFALRFWPREFRERYGDEIATTFDRHPSLAEFFNVLVKGTGIRLESVGLNLILVLRSLWRSWLAALVAIAAIAFGVGANVTGAAILNAALLRPLPVPDSQQVYYASEPTGMTYADGTALQRAASPYGSIAISEDDHKAHVSAGRSVVLSGALVDLSYFSVLRIRPILGTLFNNGSTASSIVLSERFWRSNYGGGDIIGKLISLDDRTYKVAGIVPASFHGLPQYDINAAYWIPLAQTQPRPATDFSFTAVVRTKDGLDPTAASSSIGRILEQIDQSRGKHVACCVSVVAARAASLMRLKPLLLLFYVITWIVLIIACINVANLQLARSLSASSQRATRAALGATPGQINAEIITDIALLSTIGCSVGLLIAWGILQLGAALLPVLSDVSIDISLIFYAVAVIILMTAIIAALPSIAQARANIALTLKGVGKSTAGRHGRRFIGRLVFVQVCLTAMLALVCGAVLNAVADSQRLPNGFSTHNLYVASIENPEKLADSKPGEVRDAYARRASSALVTALNDTPGVIAAAAATQVPFFCCIETTFSISNGASDILMVYAAVTPEYFSALDIPLKLGRFFNGKDNYNREAVTIVDTLFAQRYYGRLNVLGERLIGRSNYRIVGVVSPVRQEYGVPPKPMVYLPMAQFPRFKNIVVRTNGNFNDVGRLVVSSAHLFDSSMPAPTVYSYDEVVRMRETPAVVGSWTILVFSVVALALAFSGVYAISAFSSQLRQREFAIRSALGATHQMLLIEAVWRPLLQSFVAVFVGAILAYALTGILSLVLSVDLHLTVSSVIVAFGIFSGCVIYATIAPALSALRVSAATLLRSE